MNTAKIEECEIAPDIDYAGGGLIVVLGSSWTGKTHWLGHCFKKYGRTFNYGLVYCSTLGMNDSYDWLPKENKTRFWNDVYTSDGKRIKGFETMLRELMVLQRRNLEQLGREKTPKIFIIVEDPMGTVDFHNSKIWNEIAGQIRHFMITIFVCLQYIKYVSPAMRNAMIRFVIFQNTEDDLIKAKQLVIGWSSKADWLRFIISETQEYGGVLYDRLTRKFHCFKAPREPAKFYLSFF